MLFGGIPLNCAVILTSPSCDERDLLIERFLQTGAERNQVTFYITCGRASGVKNLVDQYPKFYLFICNPQSDKIIEDGANAFKMKGVENLNNITIALTSTLRKLSSSIEAPRRCCIEIVSDVLLQHQALQTRRWLTGLIPELKSKGFTILAVMDPGMHSAQEVRAAIDLFDGEVNIREKETAEGTKKLLRIRKMYNQKYSKSELELS